MTERFQSFVEPADRIANTGGGTTLGNLTIGGAFALGGPSGDITQANGSTLTVQGRTTVDAATRDVKLNGAGNDFVGPVDAHGYDIALVDGHGDPTLGNVDAAGALTASSLGGTLGQAAGTTIRTTADATLQAPGSHVTIGKAGNTFGGAATVVDVEGSRAIDAGSSGSGGTGSSSGGADGNGSGTSGNGHTGTDIPGSSGTLPAAPVLVPPPPVPAPPALATPGSAPPALDASASTQRIGLSAGGIARNVAANEPSGEAASGVTVQLVKTASAQGAGLVTVEVSSHPDRRPAPDQSAKPANTRSRDTLHRCLTSGATKLASKLLAAS